MSKCKQMVAWTSCRKTAVMIPHCLFTHLLRCTLLPPSSPENLGQANLWIEAQDTLRTTDHATCISIEWLINHESTYWKKSPDGTGKPNLQSPWGLSSGIASHVATWISELPGRARLCKKAMDVRIAWSGSAGQDGHGCPNCPVRLGRARRTWVPKLPSQVRPGKMDMDAEFPGQGRLGKMDMNVRIVRSGSDKQNGHGCPN